MKIPKTVIERINEINTLIPIANLSDYIPTTYAGTTHAMYVIIKEIKVKNQFVTIIGDDCTYNFIKKERFNINKEDGLKELKYTLSIILKSLKKVI